MRWIILDMFLDMELVEKNICQEEEDIFERKEDKEGLDTHWKISIEKIKSERINEDDLVPQPNFSFSKERKVKLATVFLLRRLYSILVQ